jgi:hypothetical protein
MKKLGLALCLTAAAYTLPVAAQTVFTDCNMNGLDKMRSQAQKDHVFYARQGNKGKGNGGESINVTLNGFTPTAITCISTADENTGGELDPPLLLVPEIDPGKNQPRLPGPIPVGP